jgi:hypothetical protein
MTPNQAFQFKILLFSVFLLILLVLTGCVNNTENTSGDALNFTFTTLDGQTKQLSDYYGPIILLDLMGARCQPCQIQMFELKKVSENYTRNQVIILSINVWVSLGEDAALTQELINLYPLQVGITLDWTFGLDDTQGTILNAYAPDGVPTLYILDSKGNIYYTNVGYEEYTQLKDKIDELL